LTSKHAFTLYLSDVNLPVSRSGNTVHVNVIGDWVDPFPFTVRSIGISTTWGSTGKWKIQIKGRII
jgi:hypothetical protein